MFLVYPDPLDTGGVLRVYVFQAERADGSYLRDVLAVFCPVEVRCVARKNDNAFVPSCSSKFGFLWPERRASGPVISRRRIKPS